MDCDHSVCEALYQLINYKILLLRGSVCFHFYVVSISVYSTTNVTNVASVLHEQGLV